MRSTFWICGYVRSGMPEPIPSMTRHNLPDGPALRHRHGAEPAYHHRKDRREQPRIRAKKKSFPRGRGKLSCISLPTGQRWRLGRGKTPTGGLMRDAMLRWIVELL